MKMTIKEEGKNYLLINNNQKKTIKIFANCELEIIINNADVVLKIEVVNAISKLNILNQKNVKLDLQINLLNSSLIINELGLTEKYLGNKNLILNNSNIAFSHKLYAENNSYDSIKIKHQTANNESKINCLGIGDKAANISFMMQTKVNKKSSGIINQKAKVIALDKKVTAKLEPTLKINHHQVTGSHSAVFSRITEQDMYYLLARGLDKENAKKLIIKSNLLLNNENFHSQIEEVIK